MAADAPDNHARLHPATLALDELLQACAEKRVKRSGPGGQHRNKVETAVILVHTPTGISAEASERRSQAENRQVALARLRMRLAIEHRTPANPVGPSAVWRARSRGAQLSVSASHDDYQALVAEALDLLQATRFHIPPAATKLGVTGTQLVRLFKKCPAAWAALNSHRAHAGLPKLK